MILGGTFALFLVNQFLLKPFTNNFIIHDYLNDFLAMGILLPWANLCLLSYPYGDLRLVGPLGILALALGAGIFWEYITPLYLSRAVTDGWDLLAYVGGGGLYWLLLRLFYLNRERFSPAH